MRAVWAASSGTYPWRVRWGAIGWHKVAGAGRTPQSVMDLYEITGDPDSPLVVSVPHTGTRIPPQVRRRLAVPVETAHRRVDAHVWELARLAESHATVIRAAVSRAVVDLNRSGAISWVVE